MNLSDYILKDFEPLTLNSLIKEAKHLCELLPISHIPIVENEKLIGCFLQSDIQSLQNEQESLASIKDFLVYFSIDTSASILELLGLFANNDANIMPVITDQKYMGYYELSDILDAFASSPFIASSGFDLIVEKNNKEYAMSQVAQIVESNNASLLGCFISAQDTHKTQITLKIASQEINEIIQTFRRYNYLVLTEHKDDEYLEELKDRAQYLHKFLNT